LQIAAEFGFSESAFVINSGDNHVFNIRYFSPKKEIPLCGHATLAASKIIFELYPNSTIRFVTGENLELEIKKEQDFIVMSFPVYDTEPLATPAKILEALGIESVMNTAYSPKNKIVLLEMEDAQQLAALQPDFAALVNAYENINGVLVTARAVDDQYDYHYRYFWPWAGTNEDPVTGGVQTFLAKYWSKRLLKKHMTAFQSSSRTGFMKVELQEDKVLIYGKAVKFLEGTLSI
jgi:PhzF family phenazine biosynthesis protein